LNPENQDLRFFEHADTLLTLRMSSVRIVCSWGLAYCRVLYSMDGVVSNTISSNSDK